MATATLGVAPTEECGNPPHIFVPLIGTEESKLWVFYITNKIFHSFFLSHSQDFFFFLLILFVDALVLEERKAKGGCSIKQDFFILFSYSILFEVYDLTFVSLTSLFIDLQYLVFSVGIVAFICVLGFGVSLNFGIGGFVKNLNDIKETLALLPAKVDSVGGLLRNFCLSEGNILSRLIFGKKPS